MKQYRIIEIKTGKLLGYMIGKTANQELVYQLGVNIKKLKITPRTEAKYRVDVLEIGSAK